MVVKAHPIAIAIFIGVLVLIVLILAFMLTHYKGKAEATTKSGFEAGSGEVLCKPGWTLLSNGGTQYCMPPDYAPNLASCGQAWDQRALAEARAFGAMGAFGQQDVYGESALQAAIGSDGLGVPSDPKLMELLHQGGSSS